MTVFASLLAGLVFGLGLIVSGMADPAKVLGFLDLSGAWDPSLAFVMAGAIAVGALAFAVARKRTVSFLGAAMKLPTSPDIDSRLVIGSVVFGIGWGSPASAQVPAWWPWAWVRPRRWSSWWRCWWAWALSNFSSVASRSPNCSPPEARR